MRVLLLGFYGHQNLGDDIFQDGFNHLLKDFEIDYKELAHVTSQTVNEYDRVIVGGGDLLSDFWGAKMLEIFVDYKGYLIAVGVGISFESCIRQKYIQLFDDIVLREKTDLSALSLMLGSSHIHYKPDLAFSYPLNIHHTETIGNRVGVCLVGTMMDNASLFFVVLKYLEWLQAQGVTLELIPFCTESSTVTGIHNDVEINDKIYRTLSQFGPVINHTGLTRSETLSLISQMDMCVCARFHAHIFCIRLGIPFVSIPITRKVELLLEETNTQNLRVPILRNSSYQTIKFDLDAAQSIFHYIRNHREELSNKMKDITVKYERCWSDSKVQNLLTRGVKRTISSIPQLNINPEEIYIKYRDAILGKGVNYFTDPLTDGFTVEEVNKMADEICYALTLDAGNEYAYGTRVNLMNNPKSLRDMVYWIHHDVSSKSKKSQPVFNMTYMCQNLMSGVHRSGWEFAVNALQHLSSPYGVYLDTYADKTFGWAADVLSTNAVVPYTNWWVGFLHHTFNEEFSPNNCTQLFKTNSFLISLETCKGIYVLTEYLAEQVRDHILKLGYTIPVNVLTHPTEFVETKFDMPTFMANKNKMLIKIGGWYRDPFSIHLVNTRFQDIKICALKGKKMDGYFPPEQLMVKLVDGEPVVEESNIWCLYFIKYFRTREDWITQLKGVLSEYPDGLDLLQEQVVVQAQIDIKRMIDHVTVVDTLDNDGYDGILSKNVVFLDLVDASAANTLIECIVRNTPVLVNRIPPVVEALGEKYPLFYDTIDDIYDVFEARTINNAHLHLKGLNKEPYRLESFVRGVYQSSIYKSLTPE